MINIANMAKRLVELLCPQPSTEDQIRSSVHKCPFCGAMLRTMITTKYTAKGHRGEWTEEYICSTKRKFILGRENQALRSNECINRELNKKD